MYWGQEDERVRCEQGSVGRRCIGSELCTDEEWELIYGGVRTKLTE